jgi:steroid delta-isomerase-like uncharacterized protein
MRPNLNSSASDLWRSTASLSPAVAPPRSSDRTSVRLRIVEEHVRLENQHDLDGVMGTFGATAHYDDQPWGEHYAGLDGVRAYYTALLSALPDLHIEVHKRHASDDAIILEAVISGQHLGPWRGLPPTGRRVEFPLCGIFAFDAADRLAGEKIYYDRATVLRQLGVFHEPEHILGRLGAVLMHPLTMARIVSRRVLRQR